MSENEIVNLKTPQMSADEQTIVELLKQALPKTIIIEPFPADVKLIDLGNITQRIFVHYDGSNSDTAEHVQNRTFKYTILFYVKEIRGRDKSFMGIERVRQALQDYPMRGDGGRIKVTSDKSTGRDAGLWEWEINIEFKAKAIANNRPISGSSWS